VDAETGYVASAKHPRKWSGLLACRAEYIAEPGPEQPLPAVQIALPDGSVLRSDAPDTEERLSRLLGRRVRLQEGSLAQPTIEKFWPADGSIAPQGAPSPHAGGEAVTTAEISRGVPGGFFDFGALQLLTTATLAHLQGHHAAGRFDSRRFRPNLVVEADTDASADPFPESGWVGRTLAIGEVVLRVLMPVPRCVVTTLAQADLPADPEILRTVARHNRVPVGSLGELPCVGVYVEVLRGGTVQRGAHLRLE
jgi:hypothetical protein